MTTTPPATSIEYNYRTYRLDPNSSNVQFLAGKYASLSLLAMTTDPESFGMSYSLEASFSPSDWIKRVTRPNVHLFVCVAHPSTVPASDLSIENGAWIGMVTQIGATPKNKFWITESGSPEPLDDSLETKWHQTSTWTDPAHRGKGVAKQLIEAGIAYAAASITGTVQQARLRAITGPHNEASKLLYGRRGFPQVGKCTIPEAMAQNGNEGFPFQGRTDWPPELLSSRLGVVMERVVTKGEIEGLKN